MSLKLQDLDAAAVPRYLPTQPNISATAQMMIPMPAILRVPQRRETSCGVVHRKLVSGLDRKTFEIKSHNVTKLAGLIDGLAAGLQVPPSRVRTAAAQLRKHKLLTSGPRGPGAPEMTPEDATNLLLALMYDGELAEAHETVSRLRAANIRFIEGIRYTDGHREILKTPPKNGFITSEEGETFDLGTVIAILLDWFVRYGRADEGGDEDIDLDPVNIGLEVTSPGYRAKLNFNTPYGLFWRVDYEWKSAEQLEYEAANKGNIASTAWASRKGPYMWSSRSVGENSLWRIADCLRGYEWNDGLEEIRPPYEMSEEREGLPA